MAYYTASAWATMAYYTASAWETMAETTTSTGSKVTYRAAFARE